MPPCNAPKVFEELKALYVAVTRAKERVIFFEQDEVPVVSSSPCRHLRNRVLVAASASALPRPLLPIKRTNRPSSRLLLPFLCL
jgi:hypothetical protein